jgi:hypothetical protein
MLESLKSFKGFVCIRTKFYIDQERHPILTFRAVSKCASNDRQA